MIISPQAFAEITSGRGPEQPFHNETSIRFLVGFAKQEFGKALKRHQFHPRRAVEVVLDKTKDQAGRLKVDEATRSNVIYLFAHDIIVNTDSSMPSVNDPASIRSSALRAMGKFACTSGDEDLKTLVKSERLHQKHAGRSGKVHAPGHGIEW